MFKRTFFLVGLLALSCSDSETAPPAASVDGGADALPVEGGAPPDATSLPDAAPDAEPFVLSQGALGIFTVGFEPETPEQIGLVLTSKTPPVAGATMDVRFRAAGTAAWRQGHPLLSLTPKLIDGSSPKPVDEGFAGTLFDLAPKTTYQVELTLREPGKSEQVYRLLRQTRALPAASGSATQTAKPGDNLQAKLDALKPGDVLELEAGEYPVQGLVARQAGTAEKPIVVRGKTRTGVVLKSPSRGVIQVEKASHLIVENLTLQGSGVDSGTDASSYGVVFAVESDNVTLRDLDLRGVDQGIVSAVLVRQVLAYNNDLRGNNVWNAAAIETNATWNDEGIKLPGTGNAIFENSIHGFGDAISFSNGGTASGCYIYRNRITMTGDDAFEVDYSQRNIGVYDNYVANSATFLSLDPLWAGPLYVFRNVSINTIRGPFKLNDTNSGFLIYNNTIVRTEGKTGWAAVQFNNGALNNWSYRNNLLVYQGPPGQLLAMEPPGQERIDFTNNGWFPDGQVWWTGSGGSFASLDEARTKLPTSIPLFGTATQRHAADFIVESSPFATSITLGASHLTEFTAAAVPVLRGDSKAKRAGVAIPNVTDGFSGGAPDVGALIEGRTPVRWGAQR
jgi:hypothetical protein